MKGIQLRVSDEKFEELEELRKTLGLADQKDLINNACSLLQWAVKERQKAREIASVDHKARLYTEVSMPCLDQVTPKP